MASVYDHWLVALSIFVAMLVSYTALRLAARVAASEGHGARIWLGIGAIAMGVGIWSLCVRIGDSYGNAYDFVSFCSVCGVL